MSTAARKIPQQSLGSERLDLPKAPTGISGFDEITGGGLPAGRPTLVCGSAGCGKTIFAIEFLMYGILRYAEPGVFVSFEESAVELSQNVRSLGFDLGQLVAEEKLIVDHVRIERAEIEETGDYNLDGLFVRIGLSIDSIGAKRIVLDTLESLFATFTDQAILRAELRRLFSFLKSKGVTAVITGERGDGQLTRQGLEEYVSDCVILLDHRVSEQISTRRLRVVKYRGTFHGTNEYPFLIDEDGISVLPVTSLRLAHEIGSERIPSGVDRLDTMLGGAGYYRGSSILVSGTAGTGKTSLAAHLVNAACERGERCMYFAFEESPAQFLRNMTSIGLQLKQWVDKGLLHFHAARPTLHGLEMHLALMHKLIERSRPDVVVVDPISNFSSNGTNGEAQGMVLRLIDLLKRENITAFFTSLNSGGKAQEQTDVGVSSIIDTWILLRDIELGGERNRGIYILKSRGMAHSNQIREFTLTPEGIKLLDVYVGPEGVLTGSMRVAQEAREKSREAERELVETRKRRELERKRKSLEAQIAALKLELSFGEEELELAKRESKESKGRREDDCLDISRSRKSELTNGNSTSGGESCDER